MWPTVWLGAVDRQPVDTHSLLVMASATYLPHKYGSGIDLLTQFLDVIRHISQNVELFLVCLKLNEAQVPEHS